MYWKDDNRISGDFKVVSGGINHSTGKWEYTLADAKTGETHNDGKRVAEAELGRTQ